MTAIAATPRPLEAYRDDGPLARAIGAIAGRILRLPPVVFVVAGALPLLAALALLGDGASDTEAGLAIAWFVVVAGLSGGRADPSSFRWLPAPLLRLTEYAAVIWLGTLAGGTGVPAAFALLGALAYRHYDIPYRIRHQSAPPPAWIEAAGGGWAGRLIVVYVLLVLDAVPAGLFVLAGLLGALFVTESASSWARRGGSGPAVVYEDEEDEGD